jgi:hypothetical protein
MTELGVVSHNRALPLRDGRRPAHSLCSGTDSRRSAKGVNPIFGLALEQRLWLALRPSRGEPHRRGVRRIEASEAANRHVRLTSTRAAGFEQKRPPADSSAYDSTASFLRHGG